MLVYTGRDRGTKMAEVGRGGMQVCEKVGLVRLEVGAVVRFDKGYRKRRCIISSSVVNAVNVCKNSRIRPRSAQRECLVACVCSARDWSAASSGAEVADDERRQETLGPHSAWPHARSSTSRSRSDG